MFFGEAGRAIPYRLGGLAYGTGKADRVSSGPTFKCDLPNDSSCTKRERGMRGLFFDVETELLSEILNKLGYNYRNICHRQAYIFIHWQNKFKS